MAPMKFTDEFRKWLLPHLWKEDEPEAHADVKYDPAFGFENRQPKKIKATYEDMESVNLEPEARDSCAHIHIAYRTCMHRNNPIWWRCNGYVNEIKNCYYEERIHDMKEFERERRLNARERKLKEQRLS